ncbi:hypothetical protein LQZ18_18295 [Lachnospiraceae bacterium ZAX-1]
MVKMRHKWTGLRTEVKEEHVKNHIENGWVAEETPKQEEAKKPAPKPKGKKK